MAPGILICPISSNWKCLEWPFDKVWWVCILLLLGNVHGGKGHAVQRAGRRRSVGGGQTPCVFCFGDCRIGCWVIAPRMALVGGAPAQAQRHPEDGGSVHSHSAAAPVMHHTWASAPSHETAVALPAAAAAASSVIASIVLTLLLGLVSLGDVTLGDDVSRSTSSSSSSSVKSAFSSSSPAAAAATTAANAGLNA